MQPKQQGIAKEQTTILCKNFVKPTYNYKKAIFSNSPLICPLDKSTEKIDFKLFGGNYMSEGKIKSNKY